MLLSSSDPPWTSGTMWSGTVASRTSPAEAQSRQRGSERRRRRRSATARRPRNRSTILQSLRSAFGVELFKRHGDFRRHDIFGALPNGRITRDQICPHKIRKLAHDFRDDSSEIGVAHGLCDALLIRLGQARGLPRPQKPTTPGSVCPGRSCELSISEGLEERSTPVNT